MPRVDVVVSTPIERTPRVMQLEGLFDIPPTETTGHQWTAELPIENAPWNVGLIVGPSGCGKSTIARKLFPKELTLAEKIKWPKGNAIVDGFPEEMPIKDVCSLLSSVGFSSPPFWLRPYSVLSTGQQFRAALARILAESPQLAVVDEFTSVVDRTVAQIASAAVAKTVRQRNQRFVAISCHEDVEEWLQPDWVYRPAENTFQWRLLQQRPPVTLEIFRCRSQAWGLFRHHHYLDTDLNKTATCFLATWRDRPVCFSAWLPFPGKTRQPIKREHRTVTLPDYQGVGIGFAVSTFIASVFAAQGYRATSVTTHPAFIASRKRSPLWRMYRQPSMCARPNAQKVIKVLRHAMTRLTASFEYVGPPADEKLSRQLLTY